MLSSSYIECGKIVNTHACHGGLKLESWCNEPEDLAALKKVYIRFGKEYRCYRVLKASIFKQFVIFTLEGVDTMDLALSLKGQTVYADREDFDLEDGEYFIVDLIGLDVIDADNGTVYGKLSDMINRGASDIYVVTTPSGERMIPVVDEFVDHVDIKKGIFVRPIEGMLD